MSKYRNARELALKVLYQIDVGKLPPDEAMETSFEVVNPSEDEQSFVEEMVRGVLAEADHLDSIISDLAVGWKLERIARVDRSVLRLAMYEMEHYPEVPVSVIINDAVEIAKKFSMEDSGRFVNGILGSFLRRREQSGGPAVEMGTH